MINTTPRPPLYDPEAVQPMRDELVYVGFQEIDTPDKVKELLDKKDGKTTLVMINSVCGCAAGSARPGITLAAQNDIIPDRFATVFAGQDRDAVDYFRENYLSEYPPSSPSMALFRDGEVLSMMPRHFIEGKTAEQVAEALKNEFVKNCERQGPSISEEAYSKLVHARACGSRIPLNEEK